MLTHGLRALFLNQSSITSLVPAQTVGRISFPCVFVESAVEGVKPPYVLVKHVGTDPLMTLDSTYNSSLQADNIDIESVSYSLESARVLGDTVRTYFEDYSGNVTADGITDVVKAVEWQNRQYDYDYPSDGCDSKFHKSIDSFLVHFTAGT